MDTYFSYCCENKCFLKPRCQVDGMACTICEQFSFCGCDCIETYDRPIYVKLSKDKKIQYLGFLEFKAKRDSTDSTIFETKIFDNVPKTSEGLKTFKKNLLTLFENSF